MGQVLTSVLWSIIYSDFQNGALVSNLTNFQMERKNALSITSLSHWVASKGLSPTLVCSAGHRPRKVPYEPAASCILELFNLSALTETCCGGILCSWGSQHRPQPEERHFPEIPRK